MFQLQRFIQNLLFPISFGTLPILKLRTASLIYKRPHKMLLNVYISIKPIFPSTLKLPKYHISKHDYYHSIHIMNDYEYNKLILKI